MLLAAAAGTGAKVTDVGIARDTAANVEAALDKAISEGADILITTGGLPPGCSLFVACVSLPRGPLDGCRLWLGFEADPAAASLQPSAALTFGAIVDSTDAALLLLQPLPLLSLSLPPFCHHFVSAVCTHWRQYCR
jgi:hypothetical protein